MYALCFFVRVVSGCFIFLSIASRKFPLYPHSLYCFYVWKLVFIFIIFNHLFLIFNFLIFQLILLGISEMSLNCLYSTICYLFLLDHFHSSFPARTSLVFLQHKVGVTKAGVIIVPLTSIIILLQVLRHVLLSLGYSFLLEVAKFKKN